jgi:hypothetical protein
MSSYIDKHVLKHNNNTKEDGRNLYDENEGSRGKNLLTTVRDEFNSFPSKF